MNTTLPPAAGAGEASLPKSSPFNAAWPGLSVVGDAESVAQALFSGDIVAMSVAQLLAVCSKVPSRTVSYAPDGWRLVELLTESGVTASNSEATKLIRGGGIDVNDRRITDEMEGPDPAQAIEGQLFVVRKGKKEYFLIRVCGPGMTGTKRQGRRYDPPPLAPSPFPSAFDRCQSQTMAITSP
jgi:hypothetical protein